MRAGWLALVAILMLAAARPAGGDEAAADASLQEQVKQLQQYNESLDHRLDHPRLLAHAAGLPVGCR